MGKRLSVLGPALLACLWSLQACRAPVVPLVEPPRQAPGRGGTETRPPRAPHPKSFYAEGGFGTRWLGDDDLLKNPDEREVIVLGLSMAGFFDDTWGLEGGTSFSFPGGSSPGSPTPAVETSVELFELWLGPCYRVTAATSPIHVRAGLGLSWLVAGVDREQYQPTFLEDSTRDRSFAAYAHVLALWDTEALFRGTGAGTGPSWTIGLDLRGVVGSRLDLFGTALPRQSADVDHVQVMFVMGAVH